MKAQTPCPVCGSYSGTLLSSTDGKSGQPLRVLMCDACGLGRQDPLPTEAELAQWYEQHYRQDYKQATQPSLRHVLRAGRLALQRWQWARRHQPQFQPLRTLDVGASSGEFVYLMRHLGCQARGIEPHAGYSLHARQHLGLEVATGSLQSQLALQEPGSVDLLSMFHVFEHLTQPIETLEALRDLLSPNGLLLLEMPDASAFSSPKNVFFRAHTLYFTPHTLDAVMRAAGLEIVARSYGESANLMVLARRAEGQAKPAAHSYQPSNALLEGLHKRKWHRYLVRRVLEGYTFKRLAIAREEKRSAAGHPDARTLLDSLYSQAVRISSGGTK